MISRAHLAAVLILASACEPSHGEHQASSEHDHQGQGHAAHDPATHSHAHHAAAALPADAPLAGGSLYHLQAPLTEQRGAPLELQALRGSVVLAAMFYASCTSVCPMLIAQVKRVHDALPTEARARTHVLLISLDPARDTTDKLAELAQRHGVDDPLYHLARTDEANVRALAALLGIRYRVLPDGEISHSPVLALLDREGVLVARVEDAGSDVAPLVAAAQRLHEPSAALQATTK